jgi:nitrate reductase gamma subunit
MIIETVLLLVFFLILHEGLNDGGSSIVGPVLFILSAIIGILIALFFPLDAGGELITFRGKMHLVLVVIMGILQIVGMVALWFRLQSVAEWSAFATYSLISAIISFILVIIAGVYATSNYKGLIERLMVTPYQLYYFVLSLLVFLHN